MKEEFNPSKKDLLLVEQLILDIKSKKNNLVDRKIRMQNTLGELRAKYSEVEFNGSEFKKIKNRRSEIKKIVGQIDVQIKSLNEENVFKNKLRNEIVFFIKHNKSLEGKEDLDRIVLKIENLKKKYSEFAKDRTRISSLRIMASEIIDELEKILK